MQALQEVRRLPLLVDAALLANPFLVAQPGGLTCMLVGRFELDLNDPAT